MSARALVANCVALALAACSLGGPAPKATTYVVEPDVPAVGEGAKSRLETLRMGNVRVAAAFAGPALVYRLDDVQFASDPYHAFIADPGGMLGSRMAEWLESAGPFKTVVQPASARSARLVLEAIVTELYGDFRPGRQPAAVMTIQFALVELGGAGGKVTVERTISRRVALPQATPDALVRGYGRALGEILAELSLDLARAQGG